MIDFNKIIFIIPARGGSKGLKNKNIKILNGKPLIYYTLKEVKKITNFKNVFLSTDSIKIKNIAEKAGLKVPKLRPKNISGDNASLEDVINHSLDLYSDKNFEYIVVLQPTSPLRKAKHIVDAINQINEHTELICSVKVSDSNPYYVLFEEKNKYLTKIKKGNYVSRQDCPTVYELNGAIFIINVDLFKKKGYSELKKEKFLMKKEYSIDIDDVFDFKFAELLLKQNY
jgi:CMP-N,N'-diacetyllegionaminic acid synthase